MIPKIDELRARFDLLKKRSENWSVPSGTLDESVGEPRVRILNELTEAEAVKHLKTIDDSLLIGDYLVLSRKLTPAALADICLAFLKRESLAARMQGAAEIGVWLLDTQNKDVCRTLAEIVRNPHETTSVRRAAYCSLELIATGDNPTRWQEIAADSPPTTDLPPDIDWKLVDSFLL